MKDLLLRDEALKAIEYLNKKWKNIPGLEGLSLSNSAADQCPQSVIDQANDLMESLGESNE